jgi:long-chain fatty acid transport protein
VGAGLDFRISSVVLERDAAAVNPYTLKPGSVASIKLDSDTNTGIGFNVGVLAKPTEDLSIGLSYRHKVKVDYTGSATFTQKPTGNADFDALAGQSLPKGATPVQTALEFPAIFSGGIAYNYEDWTFEADVNWYQWSTFGTLPLTFTEHPELSSKVEERYTDSWQYRFGLERRLSDTFAVRGGYFYDQSPAPVESVSPLLPDADRHGACIGFTWRSGAFHVDVANWYLFFKERSTEGKNRDNYNGTYKNSAELFAISLGYGF